MIIGTMELSEEDNLISSDPGTKGFDLSAGNDWIYPLNYPVREYQINITKNALFNNTLVCLPTGLGKTLIAAVVMYNFWRWYPRGKIIFLAPTKPLVAQQIAACHDIMGIPSKDTIELTGNMVPKNRQVAWFTKRVIFATPQVFQNDLEKEILSGEMVRCVVIDEAHKALGKHAYCESLRLLRAQNKCFRVLALSATPGSKIDDVCQVMKNLLISNLELRDETSPDIIPYLNKRQVDIILVPLDNDLARFKEQYVSIMDRHVRLLVQYNVLNGSVSTISKGRIFYLYKEFQSKTNRPRNHGQITRIIARCMSLYHAYDLLIRHGLRAFASFCQTHSSEYWITDEPALQDLVQEIQSFLGPFPNIHPLPDGTVEEIPENLVLGHTKFHKLRSLLVEHFEKFAAKNEETRAIVFVEYRDSVNEVYISLLQSRPMLRPKMFVGQAGQKRKQQMQAMQAFRNNEANVLISTSVGEEGLDVGEVDLIVCFDISQSSPIRLVQRMGRTGRRRDGRIVMLVTDGKEHQALKSTILKKDSLNNKVLHSSNVVSALYQESPRMVPPDMNPVCSKRHIVHQPKTPAAKRRRKRQETEDNVQKEYNKKTAAVAKSNTAITNKGEKANPKPTQSSMLKFFKKAIPNEEPANVVTPKTQPSQENQPSTQVANSDSVKLFTSDSAAVEFLTSCAIQASKLDEVRDGSNRMDKTYLVISSHDAMDQFFDYPVPDLDILNCIAFLKERNKFVSPEVIEDFEFNEIDKDFYVPEINQSHDVEYRESSEPPADGKFDYEDLFEDSCESDETAIINDRQFITSDNNAMKLPKEGNYTRDFQRNTEAKKDPEEVSPEKDLVHHAVSDKVLQANEQQREEKNCLSRAGFESILDTSSESEDIPTSQGELDANIKMKIRRLSPANSAIAGKQSTIEIEESMNKPSTSYASNVTSEIQKNMFLLNNEKLEISTNSSHLHTKSSQRWTLSLNSNKINNSVDINKPSHSNNNRASCLHSRPSQSAKVNKRRNTSSPSFSSRRNEQSEIDTISNFKTEVQKELKTSNTDKNINQILEDDDDVIFLGATNGVTEENKSSKKSINVPNNEDDDEVIFEKEVSFREKNDSHANSSTSTLTQILELIDNITPRKINFSRIKKDSANSLKPNQSKLTNTLERPFSSYFKTSPPEKPIDTGTSVSHYFTREIDKAKKVDVGLKVEEQFQDELDLSDIKWEDDFVTTKQKPQCNEFGPSVDEHLDLKFQTSSLNKKEQSFKTNSENSGICLQLITDKCEPSLLNKKEESCRINSDNSAIFQQSKEQVSKSSPVKMAEFDLGDFEWDSDFETPANPVESLKRFCNLNEMSPNKSMDESASGLTSNQVTSFKLEESKEWSNFTAPKKKKLSIKKSKTLRPSTSKSQFDNDSDFEDDFFHKSDRKFKTGGDHGPTTNYMLAGTRSPLVSRGSKRFKSEKENAEPNTARTNLNSLSAGRKDRERKVPFSERVCAGKKKFASLDHYPFKRKKYQSRNRVRSEFLDYEAEIFSNTSSGSSGDDDDLDGFVSHTQEVPETVDMRGHYLQSIKDMHQKRSFGFKECTAVVPDDEIFSQPGSQDSTYLHDSFCVSGGEEDNFLGNTHQDSLLESTERILENKKRKNSTNGRTSVAKRRRLVEKLSDSNSSEDETENLRKQILEESFNLKREKKH